MKNTATPLKESDPDKYVAEMLRYCADLERLNREYADLRPAMLRWDQLITEYTWLGTYYRFARRNPEKAIEFYRRAASITIPSASASPALPSLIATTLAADTMQFDLKNKAGAVAQYRVAAESIASQRSRAGSDVEGILDWWSGWLEQESSRAASCSTRWTASFAVGASSNTLVTLRRRCCW